MAQFTWCGACAGFLSVLLIGAAPARLIFRRFLTSIVYEVTFLIAITPVLLYRLWNGQLT
jgi:hypothetical protein